MIDRLFPGTMLLLLLATAHVAVQASTPPSPVNQNLGMPDGVFNNMTMEVCGSCHFNPDAASAPVKQGYLPDRHHLHVNMPIGKYSASPFPEKSRDGTHNCITCHAVDWVEDMSSPSGGYFVLQDPAGTEFRNCLGCHQQKEGVASVHHLTAKAQAAECNACHGSLINDPNGELWQLKVISYMSPEPGFGDGDWGVTGHREGGCRYCHNGGTDDISGYVVPGPNANMLTHHGTGLGQPGSGTVHTCSLCHDATPPEHTLQGCVRCHAPTSLHSIQADSDGNGSVGTYKEQPFFGHIGTSTDCMGCHMGGSATPASVMSAATADGAPLFGPLLPEIEQINTAKIIEGVPSTLLLAGAGYLVATADNNIATRVVLTPMDSDNPPLELVPENVAFTTMEVQIPPTLAPGNYSVSAVNGAMASVPVNLVVTPAVTISSVSCDGGTVTINGSGFSSYFDAVNSGTGVVDLEDSEQCAIDSWTDTKIIADCGSAVEGSIRADSLFGSATAAVDGCSSVARPRWWAIWSWWSSWSWSRR